MLNRKVLVGSLLLIFLALFIIATFQTYSYPTSEEIHRRVNYLQRVINQELDNNSDVLLLGKENHEFMLFSYSFSVYALTNLFARNEIDPKLAAGIIKEAIMKVLDQKIYSGYGIDSSFVKLDSIPEYSVLYLGHLNLMIGCYRLFSRDSSFNLLNNKISKSLFERYNATPYLNLESYPGSIWIPDNTVAIASLKLHGINAHSTYDSICSKWIEYNKGHYVHEETGVLYSTIEPETGKPLEEPRGSMLGWSIMFINQFDSAFAIDLYNNYKRQFSDGLLIFRLFKERQDSRSTNAGDIDSGPILLGYSIPANEFALGNSILANDVKTARKLERLISIGAKKISSNNEIKYKSRFFKMNISPMAEAMVLNSMTTIQWTE